MWRAMAVAAVLAVPTAASAAPMPCSERDEVLAQLGNKYQEAPVSIGIANNGGLVEVLTSTDGSTWTIILSMPNGQSCLVAAGEDWQDVARVAAGEPTI